MKSGGSEFMPFPNVLAGSEYKQPQSKFELCSPLPFFVLETIKSTILPTSNINFSKVDIDLASYQASHLMNALSILNVLV